MRDTNMTVVNYKLQTKSITTGKTRYVRVATKVIFDDGYTVSFTERMGKREAIKQATIQKAKEQQ